MRSLLITAILCPLLSQCMPHRNSIPPLSVGDAYTAFTIKNVINSTASSLSVPSSGNTIYILNFVAIGCRSCYRDYSRLQALQKQFAPNLQIILITAEDSLRVAAFLKTNKVGKDLHLPVATSDTLLASWFPHQYLSHTVWLQRGIVKGITDPQYVDENNIEILLLGHLPRWPVKNDGIPYDDALSLLSLNPKAIQKNDLALPFYSAFSERINGLPPSFHQHFDSTTASVKTTIINQPIIQAYLHAYGLHPDFPLSQVVLSVRDTGKYIYNPTRDYKLGWEMENSFCYESILPSSLTPLQQQQKIIADLDFYLNIHSCFKKINAQCFALETFQNKASKPLLGSGNSTEFISLHNLVWYINHHWSGIPAFNETGITENKFIPFNEQVFSSFQSLQPYLKQYGLQLTFTEKEVDLLSLAENEKQ